jgi:hypothetical protein
MRGRIKQSRSIIDLSSSATPIHVHIGTLTNVPEHFMVSAARSSLCYRKSRSFRVTYIYTCMFYVYICIYMCIHIYEQLINFGAV